MSCSVFPALHQCNESLQLGSCSNKRFSDGLQTEKHWEKISGVCCWSLLFEEKALEFSQSIFPRGLKHFSDERMICSFFLAVQCAEWKNFREAGECYSVLQCSMHPNYFSQREVELQLHLTDCFMFLAYATILSLSIQTVVRFCR